MKGVCTAHSEHVQGCPSCEALERVLNMPIIWTQPLPFFAQASDYLCLLSALEQRRERYKREQRPPSFGGFEQRLIPLLEEVLQLAKLVEQHDAEQLTPFLGWSGDYATLASSLTESLAGANEPNPLLARVESAQRSASAWEQFQSQRAGLQAEKSPLDS